MHGSKGQVSISSIKVQGAIPENKKGWKHELRVDMDRKLVFPVIMDTTLRPDMVLWSRQAKTTIAIELTVPREENCDEAHQRKNLNCTDLMTD